jgi:predicted NAD/FAD-dependent oxidoreductase
VSAELERQVLAAQAEHDQADHDDHAAVHEAQEGAVNAVSGDGSADPDDGARKAAEALSWLDSALEELRGALTACGDAIEAGTLDGAVVSGRMNSLVMEMMSGGAGV